jgi:hypothetical protein
MSLNKQVRRIAIIGFGNSDMPDRSKFAYTFDKLKL